MSRQVFHLGKPRSRTALFQRHRLDFAQFADGLGLFSQIILFNSSDSVEANVSGLLLGDEGQARTLTFRDSFDEGTLTTEGVFDLVIPPSGMRKLETDGSGISFWANSRTGIHRST